MMDYCHFSDFDEFLGMMKNKANEADQESDLRDAFKIFDRDNNGYIDMKELKQVGFHKCSIFCAYAFKRNIIKSKILS